MKNYTLIWHPFAFTLTFNGNVTFDDLIAANDELTSSRKLDTIHNYLIDFRQVSSLQISSFQLKRYAHYDAVMPKLIRRFSIHGAYIATSPPIEFRIQDFLRFGHRAWPRELFSSEESAMQWLVDSSKEYGSRRCSA